MATTQDRSTASSFALEAPIQLGATTITPFEVFHPAPCLAYRIERAGRVLVFCTDHELRRGGDAGDADQLLSPNAEARLLALCQRAPI